jgi:hypothetical protein
MLETTKYTTETYHAICNIVMKIPEPVCEFPNETDNPTLMMR